MRSTSAWAAPRWATCVWTQRPGLCWRWAGRFFLLKAPHTFILFDYAALNDAFVWGTQRLLSHLMRPKHVDFCGEFVEIGNHQRISTL